MKQITLSIIDNISIVTDYNHQEYEFINYKKAKEFLYILRKRNKEEIQNYLNKWSIK